MPTNDIKPFAAAGGANVLTQAEYLALAALSTGFSSGKANSKEVNKAIRQATFAASALAQFICDKSGSDVLDDGNVAGLVTKLLSAINKTSQPLDATLTAFAGLVGAANKLPYFNGTDTAALTDLTSVGRDIIGKNAIADVLTYLGLNYIKSFSDESSISSPDGRYKLHITTSGAWGVYDNTEKKFVPLAIGNGGSAGVTAADAIKNFGLSAGLPPIGIPFFWPSAAMPNTIMDEWSDMIFLKFNGATFSAATYPKLAKVIPSLKLAESRGEFIRTWDDGRGVDAGRTLLSGQTFAIQDINATAVDVLFNPGASASGAFTLTDIGPSTPPQTGGAGFAKRLNFNASLVANTATETRPRNVAFNFLVRAK